MNKPLVLGIACSLRNARWGQGNKDLVNDLRSCEDEQTLKEYLKKHANLHLRNFVEAGREEGLSFDELYRNLRTLSGKTGLSNSEVALASALWSAYQSGAEIDHLSLSEYFPAAGVAKKLDELRDRLIACDAILISGPVYFGDRGSLTQSLVRLIRDDDSLRAALQDKLYAGISVGAKRNGGQETTLIYQLLDMIDCGLLAVGNDSETTSQYGGTGCAGDVGTMASDDYGLWTSMGTGRRLAHCANLMKIGSDGDLAGPIKVAFWILQDKDQVALQFVKSLTERFADRVQPAILNIADNHIARCLACDICPTHIGVDDEYRCIINSRSDRLSDLHPDLLGHDAVIPVIYSPSDRSQLESNYQQFIERTRYLRRGDYVLGDALVAPLVIEDLGATENMSVRATTSMIRHHTVMSKPMNVFLQDGRMLHNPVDDLMDHFVQTASRLTAGRLTVACDAQTSASRYNPVGYILSAEKEKEDEKLNRRRELVESRLLLLRKEAATRLKKASL